MVVILCDQFAQLADGVVFTERQMLADVRNLGPDNKSRYSRRTPESAGRLLHAFPGSARYRTLCGPDAC